MLPDIYIALLIIFACAILVSILFQYLKQPSIVGFLLTGIMVGPHALGLLKSVEQIESLAEAGVAMLLFTIGMEFSLKDLLKYKSMALLGGLGQIVLTVVVCTVVVLLLDVPANSALFISFLVCLSSTAIGLSLLQKYDSMASAMGRLCLLILIFQDLMMVPMMLTAPLLGGEAMPPGTSSWQLVLKGISVIIVIIVIARWFMPWAMHHIAASRSKELFTVALVTLCIAICSLTVWAGLSLAIGAFIAGLIIAASPYNHQAIGYIIPLRDIFTSVFFVSIGMLLDVHFLLAHPFMVLGVTLAIMLGKTLLTGGLSLFLGLPIAQSILTGLALSQISEFSFVLANTGVSFNLLNESAYQLLLAAGILTMIITPLAFSLTQARLINWRNNWTLHAKKTQDNQPTTLKDHVIIVGFGPTGRMVARAASVASIPYIIVEMNATTVRREREKGESIVFGDAANDAVMDYLNINQARVLVVTAGAPFLINRAVAAARRANPNLYIISRVRFMHESSQVIALGANEVVTEEFETALDVFSRVLRQLSVPQNDISRLVCQLKHENYNLLLTHKPHNANYCALQEYLPGHEIIVLRVEKGSRADGNTLMDLNLRGQYGVNILAVKREDNAVDSHVNYNTRLMAGNLVVALGPPAGIEDVQHKIFMSESVFGKVDESAFSALD